MKHELSLLIPLLCFCIGVTVHVLLEESYTTLLPSSHLLSVSSQHSYTRDELTASRQDSRITRRAPRERWRWTGEDEDKLYLKSAAVAINTCV